MRWFIINDLNVIKKELFLYFGAVFLCYFLKLDIPIALMRGMAYFYSIVIILHSDLINNTAYFYTLFPKKRYFLIIQKNITVMLLSLLFHIVDFRITSYSIEQFIVSFLCYWLMGSMLLLYFFQCNVSYASSILQLTGVGVCLFLYWIREYIGNIKNIIKLNIIWNIVIVFVLILLINIFNIKKYTRKEFIFSCYKK